jgi:Cu/Ag efflux protein CusF
MEANMTIERIARLSAAGAALLMATACSSAGAVGDILGSVLGAGAGGQQVAGTIRGVNSQSQQLSLRQSNGQDVTLAFDNQTAVIYQNRAYSVTSLEAGDQVQAKVQQLQNGGYYTDSVFVTQPVQGTGTSTTGTSTTGQNVQSLTGVVRTVDRNAGQFTIDVGNGTVLLVSMPYNASQADINRFNALRTNDSVRFYGVYLNTSRVELRQFY